MDIVIVDDEPLARRRLSKMVGELGYDVLAEAADSAEAYQAVLVHDPTLLLLDIEMPGEDGLQLAQRIGRLDAPPAIIFTTAHDQFALDAFETHADGYLLKPVQRQKLQKALDKARIVNKLQQEALANLGVEPKRGHLTAKSHRGVELIPVENIRCFLADQKYVMVVGIEGKVLIDETLKQLEASFSREFIRVHRNALVSIKHIQSLERHVDGYFTVRLSGTEESPIVSRRYASKVKSFLDHL
ncbi:MAG: two-component system response regulator AlgR [Cellvibrionaceae bacterium]|jgi:two-component system response regulator AlgR